MPEQAQHIPNHAVHPETGFIESNGFLQAFDAEKKLRWLKLYRENGLKFWRTCAELGVKGDTVHHHAAIDPAFKAEIEQVKREFYDELEGISRTNATNPKSVIERIFQLKAAFPEKYGDGKRNSDIKVEINIDEKVLQAARSRSQVIDAEIVENQQGESARNRAPDQLTENKPGQNDEKH